MIGICIPLLAGPAPRAQVLRQVISSLPACRTAEEIPVVKTNEEWHLYHMHWVHVDAPLHNIVATHAYVQLGYAGCGSQAACTYAQHTDGATQLAFS